MDHIFLKGSSLTKENVAFFDLDRTLIGEISGNAIVRMAWKKGLISLSDLMTAFYLFLLFKLRLRDPLNIIDDMVGWVKGKTEAEIEKLCSQVFIEVLYPAVFPDAITEINFHKENNVKVIILSSALNYICSAMSESLGMDGYICSSLETNDGFLTGRPTGRLCYGIEKLNRLAGYCITNNVDQSLVWYYSDSISDLPVLSSIGNPVCVNPDRALKNEARKRGWKILCWQN
jgi:putative phosphoserine phosphatase / 1-acylglycerol-3-phosphate O-acyltransferase